MRRRTTYFIRFYNLDHRSLSLTYTVVCKFSLSPQDEAISLTYTVVCKFSLTPQDEATFSYL